MTDGNILRTGTGKSSAEVLILELPIAQTVYIFLYVTEIHMFHIYYINICILHMSKYLN